MTDGCHYFLNKAILLTRFCFCRFCSAEVLSLALSSSAACSEESQGASVAFLTLTPNPSLSRADFGLFNVSDSRGTAVADKGRRGSELTVLDFEFIFRMGRIATSPGTFISSASPAKNGSLCGFLLADAGGPSILTPADLRITSSLSRGISSVVVLISSSKSCCGRDEAKAILGDGYRGGVAGEESLGVRAGEA